MRFIELAVEGFQALERARIALGPGLNVLYGPNDLGKSTLASAIRAALLVPYKSADAKSFSSWYADATPRVSLTFADDQERFWQIKKSFGSGASAELLHSKDGNEFALDCKAREVDEKVRELLQWGIAALGGKGAPRGLPESFLAKVLLASQTDVDDILAASLEEDKADSGKLKLRKALAALAQDPLFKHVLDRARQEYDIYFTPQGRLRRSEGSKLIAADRAFKECNAELERLRAEREESRGIEAEVRARYEVCAGAEHAVGEAEAALASARTGVANLQRRNQVGAQLAAAERALAEIDRQVEKVASLEREQQQLGKQLEEQRRGVEQAVAECERLARAQRECEEELQRASGDAAEQARKLREAELERELAQLRQTRQQLEVKLADAGRASDAVDAREAAGKALAECQKNLAGCAKQLPEARSAVETAEQERGLADGVLAYGRYRDAEEAERRTQLQRDERAVLIQQSSTLGAEASALQEQHDKRAAELAERRGRLPTPERFKQLDGLRQQLERTEASLGGGLSIRIVPLRAELQLRAAIDGLAVVAGEGEQTFEAERSAQLQISDLVEIEISAGAADKRRELAKLRERWSSEVVPVLQKAAVATLGALDSALDAMLQEDRAAAALHQQAETRAGEARSARERAELIGKQLAGQPTHDLAARRAAIGSISLDLLEPRWRKLGRDWEARAETGRAEAQKLVAAAKTRCAEVEQKQQLASYQHAEAEKRAGELGDQAAALAAVLQGKPAREVLRALTGELEALAARERSLEQQRAGLTEQAGAQRLKADQALGRAKAASEQAQTAHKAKQSELERVRSLLDTAIGSARSETERLKSLDRAAAQRHVQACAAELAACPSAVLSSESDLAAAAVSLSRAQQALAEHREDLHKAEGALTRVGGAQLQDRLQQAQEAVDTARARERELRTDADAWKLLREALTQAETEESEHLGVALGRPVGEKLKELTAGRYSEISFDQHMTAARVRAQGATPDADVLSALSVGTRHQLATLVRLTIASQLKSAIVLDDHLVHTDPSRLGWFRDVLRKTAVDTQVLIFTCRPGDYLEVEGVSGGEAVRDLAGGTVRAIDLARVLKRWSARP